MHIHQALLETSAVKPPQYPQDTLPEIALVGRSNVGKSSFINRMVSRSKLARTSGQPGKTQTLNFYLINRQFRLVDVPGYGYARVSKTERQQWLTMIERYLSQRDNLQLVFLLMDMRHEPSPLDQQMYTYLDSLDLPFALVLTKADKVSANARNKTLILYKEALSLPTTDALFPFSAKNGDGADDIWQVIEDILEQKQKRS